MIENRRGRTSHEHFPALISGTPSFSEMHGDVWVCIWAGAATIAFALKPKPMAVAICKRKRSTCREMALEEGQTLWTPRLYASYSAHGLNGMSQQFHRYLRDNIIRFPENKPRPVHLNTWEDLLQP